MFPFVGGGGEEWEFKPPWTSPVTLAFNFPPVQHTALMPVWLKQLFGHFRQVAEVWKSGDNQHLRKLKLIHWTCITHFKVTMKTAAHLFMGRCYANKTMLSICRAEGNPVPIVPTAEGIQREPPPLPLRNTGTNQFS